ncbi:MAG: hypothetical protein PHQ23_16785 [Candidatus Wallbacteria bacterium]|nr:hypothetical protein [Candidatus Wallbacteria bacterium]
MKLVNINAINSGSCRYCTWLQQWQHFSHQQLPQFCPVLTCSRHPEVGALVQKLGDADRISYIIPLCRECAALHGEIIVVLDTTALVPVDLK